ncbi:class I SAM-dependent methyltransferase [Hyunsoonleella rubra]|uniref:Class I SAM-dependent methyltransferase n=1 Tax=Hyunsoonleella rubra TaxID=1737062 RepID=A0ABW5TEE2_9FLAO
MIKDADKFYDSLAKETVECPLCAFEENTPLYDNDRYGMGVKTVICGQCSLIYINPRPTEDEMAVFYREHYRKFYESVERPNKNYINSGPFIPRAKFVIDVLKPYLEKADSIFDFGCAEGTLLHLVEKKYSHLKTFGLEPSLEFGKYAQEQLKGDVFIGSYQEFVHSKPKDTFDILTCNHVLEHILDPKEFLLTLKGFMHKESVLYIEVPNIADNRVKGIGALHIGHVLYFDPLTLKLLLEKCGFEVLKLYTKNLPAKTPAMSAICRKIFYDLPVKYPDITHIESKKNRFLNNVVFPEGVESKNYNSLLKKLKRRFIK